MCSVSIAAVLETFIKITTVNYISYFKSYKLCMHIDKHVTITIATIFERRTASRRTAAQRDDASKELLPTFWIRPAT